MAQFKNMYKVELNNGIAPVVSMKQIYYADVEANRIGAIVTMNGQPFPLSGTCTGSAILADGSTVPMAGVIDGNQAYIDLDSSCYSVEGQIKIFVKITTGGVTTTLLAAVGTVQLTETDTVIDPGTIIPSVSALITAIEEAVESIPADYTALLETIAPMYANLTFPVKAGQWCWYSGVLYEAKQDISTSENWTAAHWGTTTVGGSVSELKSAKVNKPIFSPNGTSGQLLRTNGDGTTTWVDEGAPTDEQVGDAVSAWLDAHPEATTTVQDFSLSTSKLTRAAYDTLTRGLVYADNLGLDKFSNITDANNYSSNNNDTIIESVLATGNQIVFGTGYYPFLNHINLQNHMRIVGSGIKNTYLVFPDSDGIVFLRQLYYNQLSIESMTIISKYSCIGLADVDETKIANNIYETTFRDLYLKSLLSDCILGSKNNSGSLAFDLMIDDVIVEAPNGSGISNITGLANVFSRIRDNGSIKNIFRNCSGKFTNINTTFAGAEYFLYYDYINNYSLSLIFDNCNVETFSKGFIGMLNDRTIVNFRIDELICIKTNFTPPDDTTMTVAPVTAIDIKRIVLIDSNIIGRFPVNYTSDVKSGIVLVETHIPQKIFSDVDVNMFIPVYNREVCVYKATQITDSVLSRNYGVKKALKYDECHFELIAGQRQQYELNVSSDDIGSTNYPNLVNTYSATYPDVINVLATSELRWLCLIIEKAVGKIVTISNKNTSTNNVVIIVNNYQNGNYGFLGDSNITIEPNNSASFVLTYKNGYLQYNYLGY